MEKTVLPVLLSFCLLFTACPPPGDNVGFLDPSIPLTANSAAELKAGLARYINNTTENSIHVILNVNSLMGESSDPGSIIRDSNKFIVLDLSGSTMTEIPAYAFYGCSRLTGITLPNSVTNIGSSAFYGCSELTDIIIPNNVESISNSAFSRTGLAEINIPSSVTSIGNHAFACKLTAINVDKNNPKYTSEDDILYSKDKTILVQYPEGRQGASFTVPSGVTSLAYGAFYRCENLTSISMPNSVINIGQRVFEDCFNLVSVELSNKIEIIELQAFARCISLTNIIIPNSVKEIKECAFEFCYSLSDITIPCSVTVLRQQAFSECYNLKRITFAGTINTDNFHMLVFYIWQNYTGSFPGSFVCEFRNQFYADNPTNGTPGTYTREIPDEWNRLYPR